jgi:hypothetical protein
MARKLMRPNKVVKPKKDKRRRKEPDYFNKLKSINNTDKKTGQ